MYVMKNTTYEADPNVIFSFLLCFRSYGLKYSPRHTYQTPSVYLRPLESRKSCRQTLRN